MSHRWDAAFLRQALDWARMSKDPNTQVGAIPMRRVGKKAAGAILDGREWRQFPDITNAR